MTPTKRSKLLERYNEVEGRTTLTALSNSLKNETAWKTTRLGQMLHAPSSATISRSLRDGTWATHMIRKRPHLDAVAITERQRFCPEALERDDTFVVCHDEAYIEVGKKNGKFLVDLKARPSGNDEDEEDEEVPVTFDSGGKHEPKVSYSAQQLSLAR